MVESALNVAQRDDVTTVRKLTLGHAKACLVVAVDISMAAQCGHTSATRTTVIPVHKPLSSVRFSHVNVSLASSCNRAVLRPGSTALP